MKFPIIKSETKEVKETKIIHLEDAIVKIEFINGKPSGSSVERGQWIKNGDNIEFKKTGNQPIKFDLTNEVVVKTIEALDFLKEQSAFKGNPIHKDNEQTYINVANSLKGFTEEEQDEIRNKKDEHLRNEKWASEYAFQEAADKMKKAIVKHDELSGVKKIVENLEEIKPKSTLIVTPEEQKEPEHPLEKNSAVIKQMNSARKTEIKERKEKAKALIADAAILMKNNEWSNAANVLLEALKWDPINKYIQRDLEICNKWLKAISDSEEQPKYIPTDPSDGLNYEIPEL